MPAAPSSAPTSAPPQAEAPAFLAGGGELGERIRAHDWTRTPLGPPHQWPPSLRTAMRIMLASRQPIWVGWGSDLRFFYNDPYKSIIGGKHPAALGEPTAVVWREIWSEIEPLLATAMSGSAGTFDEQKLLIMERNGYPEETYYTFSYSPIPDEDGRAGGILCANSDDTQRVLAERQLSVLRELGAATANARSTGEAAALAMGALAGNPRDIPFALLYLPDEGPDGVTLAGAVNIDAGHPAGPPAMRADSAPWPFADALRRQETVVVPVPADRFAAPLPTGAWNVPPAQVAVVPVLPSGAIARGGVLVIGLNPYRLFDAGYRSFLNLVAGQVGSAIGYAQAYERERHRAEALAEVDRAKTTFFSNVSHEFRTPLTLMLSPLEDLLRRPDLDAEARALLDITQRNGLRLLKLVNALLDFSRIEAGRMQMQRQPTDVASFTADLAALFRSAIEGAGMALVVDCPPLPAPVAVDRGMWETIVLNLVANAFKFTFEGTITVSVRSAPDGGVTLDVTDTGIGIPVHELPRLFERFHRVSGAEGRSIEGSGIGLALVQELVRLHGGTVGVRSGPGKGSRFTVALPAAGMSDADLDAAAADATHAVAAASGHANAYVDAALRWGPGLEGDNVVPANVSDAAGPGTVAGIAQAADMAPAGMSGEKEAGKPSIPPRLAPGRVLVVDDNADLRDYMRRILGGAGHHVRLAADGEEALRIARAEAPELIVSDVMMPRLDGFGLLRELRADAALRDTPVLLLSARAGEEARVSGIGSGADDYLTKPFSARELLARVAGNLQLSRLRRETERNLRDEARTLEVLNAVGAAVSSELDLDRAVQVVTDAATELTGAAFGAFFYNVVNPQGEAYMLYTLSGVPRSAFERFPMPRNTAVFAPTFNGEGIVRADDITQDPRYGHNAPRHGMPEGHLPVRSYLAAPVISRTGEVVGGLFFGHPQPGVFTERAERLLVGIAAQAASAIDNARLYQAAQTEIAERSRAQEALHELNATLEKRIGEAVEALRKSDEALRVAQKMEAIGKLTGGVAHDFNNLLQVIGGNLQLLGNDVAADERAAQRVRNAMAGVARGAKLASQLLAFGRRQPLAPKVVNLGRFIRGLDDMLRRALGDGIEIETVVAGGLWTTMVDPFQVENSLLNLAINARDAMHGHGKLTIEAGNAWLDEAYARHNGDVAPGQYVVVAVTDTGIGMPPEIREHVFEPFFTTKPEGQGTGLGLSMVYGFVRQSGGHVKIYSEPGQGTTVRLYLPRVRQEEDVETEVDPGPAWGGSETVLVVEDDEDVRATVVEMLSDLGYRVLKAKDAASALAIVESGVPVDVLFSDVVMPGPLRSTEMARKVRERLPSIAVLFTSGYTDNAIVHAGRLDEGIDLLSKPYTQEALARKVRMVLQKAASGPARAPVPAPSPSIFLAPAPVVAPVRAPLAAPAAAPGTPRILFVEDDELVRASTAELLRTFGFDVRDVPDPHAAMAQLQAGTFDVLLTDVGLAGASGVQLAVDACARLPQLRVVFLTGAEIVLDATQRAALPHAAVVRKPYQIDAFLAVLAG